MKELDSLDYRAPDDYPTQNYYEHHTHQRKFKTRLIAKWIIYFFIGVIVGVVAWSIKQGIDHLLEWKFELMEMAFEKGSYGVAFIAWYGICILYGMMACVIVLLAGPLAGGSGVPEVKGYLNGVYIIGTINLKTFLGKVISICFGYASCLALGPEGPMVHIGSAIAGGLAAGKSRTLRLRVPKIFEKLRTPREQRDFISAGAAAGIAAAFGAPIGGVLFTIEETASFWSRELTWRTFFGCMISAFVVNAMHTIGSHGSTLLNSSGLLSFGLSRFYLYRYQELVPFLVLGALGGILGSIFVFLNIKLSIWRRDKIKPHKSYAAIEVFVVVTLLACLSFGMSMIGTCRPIDSVQTLAETCDHNSTDVQLRSLLCEKGEYNDFVNLFLVPQDQALKSLFARTTEAFSFQALSVFLVLYFLFVTVTSGLTVAGGLFVPMMLVGATYGRIVGRLLMLMFPHVSPPIDPSIYALIGSAAMMSGFSRTTISLVVILVELTENTQYLLPIMMAVMVAKWTADAFTHSLYDELMELKSITFLDHHPPHSAYVLRIKEVMQPHVWCINQIESLQTIVQILSSTSHNGFPVVKDKGEGKEKTYCGMIWRQQLLVLIEKHLFKKNDDDGHVDVLDYDTYHALLNRKWTIEKAKLPPNDRLHEYCLDVRPYMDRSHLFVQDTSSFIDAYRTFQTIGLRHLPVVNDDFQVVGILTRHDLLVFFDEKYHENMSKRNSEALSP